MKKRFLRTVIAFGLATSLIFPSYSYGISKTEAIQNESALRIENNPEIEIKRQLENSVTEFESVKETSMEKINEKSFEFESDKNTFLDNSFGKLKSSVAVAYGSTQGYLTRTEDYEIYGLEIEPGVLLQAQLHQPGDNSLDYDLYIWDSTLSSILDGSENYTYTYGGSDKVTCSEGVGIINTSTTYQTYYIMVRSSAGGSSSLPFTLRYSASYPYDSYETDENTNSAKELSLTSGGFLINTRNISAPADVDWYKVTIPSSKGYDEITLSLNAGSNNSNKAELFLDAAGNNTMLQLNSVISGESKNIVVVAGTYYIRVSYNGVDSSFKNNNVDNYTLTLAPLLKATGIQITQYYSGDVNAGYVHYPQGYYYRARGNIKITGVVFSKDPVTGENFAVPNEKVEIHMIDVAQDKEEFKNRYNDGVTNNQGVFEIGVSFAPGVGIFWYENYATTTYYDLVLIQAKVMNRPSIIAQGQVYHIADIVH